jgi:hypothetical protein
MGTLGHWEETFKDVGWFIPPYIQMGVVSKLAGEIIAAGNQYHQDDLERSLAQIYESNGLAAMVIHRYPMAPVIKDYCRTISEAVEAHFLGLNHIAVGGLIPVIEGAARLLATRRGLTKDPGHIGVRTVLAVLADDCKDASNKRNIGHSGEIESMMDSFVFFVRNFMFTDSALYPLNDKTNRHGITHGAYADTDHGRPLNFFKTIAAIDFLTLVSSFGANLSWMAPAQTDESFRLANYYESLERLGNIRVAIVHSGAKPRQDSTGNTFPKTTDTAYSSMAAMEQAIRGIGR